MEYANRKAENENSDLLRQLSDLDSSVSMLQKSRYFFIADFIIKIRIKYKCVTFISKVS